MAFLQLSPMNCAQNTLMQAFPRSCWVDLPTCETLPSIVVGFLCKFTLHELHLSTLLSADVAGLIIVLLFDLFRQVGL